MGVTRSFPTSALNPNERRSENDPSKSEYLAQTSAQTAGERARRQGTLAERNPLTGLRPVSRGHCRQTAAHRDDAAPEEEAENKVDRIQVPVYEVAGTHKQGERDPERRERPHRHPRPVLPKERARRGPVTPSLSHDARSGPGSRAVSGPPAPAPLRSEPAEELPQEIWVGPEEDGRLLADPLLLASFRPVFPEQRRSVGRAEHYVLELRCMGGREDHQPPAGHRLHPVPDPLLDPHPQPQVPHPDKAAGWTCVGLRTRPLRPRHMP